MHNKVCPQYLGNCPPPTVYYISDHNFQSVENYTTPSRKLRMTSFIPSTVSLWNKLDSNIKKKTKYIML